MAKRGNSEGCYRKRSDGLWEYRISLGCDGFGKRLYKSFYGRTKAICRQKHEEFIKKDGFLIEEKMRVGDWADVWLETYKKGIVGSSMYSQWERLIRMYIKPSLIGGMYLEEVKAVHIQRILRDMHHLSYSYITKARSLMWSLFDTAILNGLCLVNPCTRIKIKEPKVDLASKYFTVEEVKTILDESKKEDSAISLGIQILAYTGMRRGEMLGLMWSDIDFEKDVIRIRRGVILEDGKKVIKDSTKSTAGMRNILLLPVLKDILLAQEKKSLFLVHDRNNNFCDPNHFSRKYRLLVRSLPNVRPLGTHAFRHSVGTHLRRAGVDLDTIKRILGHEELETTMIYAKTSEEMEREALLHLPY